MKRYEKEINDMASRVILNAHCLDVKTGEVIEVAGSEPNYPLTVEGLVEQAVDIFRHFVWPKETKILLRNKVVTRGAQEGWPEYLKLPKPRTNTYLYDLWNLVPWPVGSFREPNPVLVNKMLVDVPGALRTKHDWCSAYYLKCLEKDYEDGKIVAGADITSDRTVDHCEPRPYYPFLSISGYEPVLPRSCAHNEMMAVARRQCAMVVSPEKQDPTSWDEASKAFIEYYHLRNPGWEAEIHYTFDDWVSRYPLARRNNMLREMENIINTREIEASSKAKSFTKREFLAKLRDECKPRLVSAMSDKFLALTGPEFYAFDKYTNIYLFNSDSPYFCTSGATVEQISYYHDTRIAAGWIPVLNDFSLFDGSQNKECITAYHKIIKAIMPECRARELLTQTTVCSGVTCNGVEYKREGGFNSGQIDTTKGNTIKNITAMHWIFTVVFGIRINALVLGDDSVIYIHPDDLHKYDVNKIIEYYGKLGLKCSPTMPADVREVEFCQQLFWPLGDGTTLLGPKPGRLISKLFHTFKRYNDPDDYIKHLRGLCVGLKVWFHVPTIQHVYNWIMGVIGEGESFVTKREEWMSVSTASYNLQDEAVYFWCEYYGFSLSDYTEWKLPSFELGMISTDGILMSMAQKDWGLDV
jgi:hypothetical protein